MENDAVVANVLQEELSRVASVEEARFHDCAQDLVLNQQWHDQDIGQKVLDDDDKCQKESNHCNGDEILFHTPEKKPEIEELRCTLNIVDESALDGEVVKRLNQMVPVPMPSEDEEVSSHQRLLNTLKVYDLVENKLEGEGNCQVCFLLNFKDLFSYRYHKHVREQIGYVLTYFSEFLKKMSKSGECGDHVTLQAAANFMKIYIDYASYKDMDYVRSREVT
ncbi:hypothetical protein K2173_000527 [Erythroxylum novogranatense]|uniref:Uncharacterized protein n=1 Tax=Erythroxylum novogranatense TaxID=1862640 RepID=A0AAV8SXE3_9ROSI|nr:hypothetical protein K2173_000527 [Erythroxylum novogranatense]